MPSRSRRQGSSPYESTAPRPADGSASTEIPRPSGSAARFVGPGNGLDFLARVLPRPLHDPRHRSLQAVRFFLYFFEHRLGEVQTLLALVALGDVRTALVLVVRHGCLTGIVARTAGARRENSAAGATTSPWVTARWRTVGLRPGEKALGVTSLDGNICEKAGARFKRPAIVFSR